jgi:hypothetical protein
MATATETKTFADSNGGSRPTENRTIRPIRENGSGGNGHDATARAPEVSAQAADASSQSAPLPGEATKHAVDTITEKLTEATLDRTRTALEDASRTVAVYREATGGTSDGIQALFASYTKFAHGFYQLQYTYVDTVSRALKRDGRRQPQDLFQSRSVTELAEVQRDLYFDVVNDAVEISAALFRSVGEIARDATVPLKNRA